jgi:hypothetical protein
MLNALLLYWYKEWLRDGIAKLAGVQRPEKTPEKISKEQRQQLIGQITQALNPLAIGTVPQEMQTYAINEVGYQIAAAKDPSLSKKEWMKDNALVYEPREGTLLQNLGAYSSGIDPIIEGLKTVPQWKAVLGKPITVTDAYGNEKKVLLTEEQQRVLVMKTLAEGLTIMGMTEADVANAIRTVWREQLKEAPTADDRPVNKKRDYKEKRRDFRK